MKFIQTVDTVKTKHQTEMNSTELIGRARDRWNEIDHEGLDWFSFFNGWLEGRADIVYSKTEPK